jgi:hypothetical protein
MRLIGYILLISGFVWLVLWFADSIVPLPRSISIENLQKYHESGNFSGAEVQDAIRSVLQEYKDNALGVVLPAMMMFVGGICLDIASRQIQKRKISN